jgi:DNA-binding CsgD family transcriptional regulator
LELQNQLLTRSLEQTLGVTCTCFKNCRAVIIEGRGQTLLLWDYLNSSPERLWNELAEFKCQKGFQDDLALFNVDPGAGIETEAIRKKVSGLFYENTPADMIIKGVKAILDGELWFSRNALRDYVLETRDIEDHAPAEDTTLTAREKQILVMLAAGAANKEIADRLCISPHTVRTHIYNLYAKIKTPNRVQAALWAANNLSELE